MISFSDYFLDNKKQYSFNIKVAGECSKEQVSKFEKSLAKIGLAAISQPKTTPVAETHTGFEHVKNTEITLISIVTNYPATPAQIQEMVKDSMSISDSLIMVTTPIQDEIAMPVVIEKEVKDKKEANSTSMLTNLEMILKQKTTEFEFAKNSNEKGKTSNDLPQGKISPIGS
jgi:CHAT domain-containing protein